jgi:SWI/SNF chromatin-remodeling complex subunit SWI1
LQPVARVLQHYYQVILGNFEELYRKNVIDQQRKALSLRSGAASQPSGQGAQTSINGNLQLAQQDVANVMGTNGAATFPMQTPSHSDHQRQPSVTPSTSGAAAPDGISGQSSVSGYLAQVSVKATSETEQDELSNKRKLDSDEADVKRARQKTGQSLLIYVY